MVYGWVGGKHACVDLEFLPLWDWELGILLWDGLPSKPLQAKWLNMRKHALTINIFLYHLHSTLLAF
jgi:hypothetical protein